MQYNIMHSLHPERGEMTEILLTLDPKYWELIKSGQKTIEIRKRTPKIVHMPFRVIVYLTGSGNVVGKFDCSELVTTIRPQYLVEGSCMTEQEIIRYSRGRALCGWRIKAGSVVEYEIPLPLEFATDLKCPPGSWCYLHKEYENE